MLSVHSPYAERHSNRTSIARLRYANLKRDKINGELPTMPKVSDHANGDADSQALSYQQLADSLRSGAACSKGEEIPQIDLRGFAIHDLWNPKE